MKLTRFSLVVGALAASSLALTACGGSSGGTLRAPAPRRGTVALTGNLNGAGSTAQQAAMQAWQAGFQGANPDVTVNYDPVGSGGGREQFLQGGVHFAGSDAALTSDELAQSKTACGGTGGAIDLPVYISPIAVAYNLPGVDRPAARRGHDRQDLRRQDHQVERPGDRGAELRRQAAEQRRSPRCTAPTTRAPRRTSPTT